MNIYRDKKILVTGHTGFKGSWLSAWLTQLGAIVIGASLDPPTTPSLYTLLRLNERVIDHRCDLRKKEEIVQLIGDYAPDLVFHLAANPIVIDAYISPVETMETNVMGTVHVLEAVRKTPQVKGVVCITTDKVYHNTGALHSYRESDRLGGEDIYSASKTMCESAIAAFATSYFSKTSTLIASARAGNVIGGGDFAANRLIPDGVRALMRGETIELRHPKAVRPWIDILDVLNGYLLLGAHQLKGDSIAQGAWNFGPMERRGVTVEEMVAYFCACWGGGEWSLINRHAAVLEKMQLQLTWDKAHQVLNWSPKYTWKESVEKAVFWYQSFAQWLEAGNDISLWDVSLEHIERYSLTQLTTVS